MYPQVLTNVRVTDKKAAQDDVDVQAAVKKVTEELGDIGRNPGPRVRNRVGGTRYGGNGK